MEEPSSTADRKELSRLLLQLEEEISAGRGCGGAAVLLSRLEKLLNTAEEVDTSGLEEVLLGLLRSSEGRSFRERVQGLLRRCSRGVEDQRGNSGSPGDPEEDPEQREAKAPEPEEPGLQSPGSTAERRSASLDPARTRCVQLLLAALLPDPPDPPDQAAELAGAIEEHIHRLHKPNQLRYRRCVRSKLANLRNPRSPHLRRGLLSGSLTPETFAHMSAEQMAGPELRRLREEICRRGVSERQLPRPEEGTPTCGVRCRRCGASDCRVTQVSRAALFLPAWVRRGGPGEDAMTFVTCGVCGQQWYHSSWNCL